MLKATVKKNLILDPLSKIQTVVDKKTTMHLLNNVLIYLKEGNFFIEATDLEISYKGKIQANIEEEGEITVSARKFFDIVKELPSEEILIEELPDYWLKISMGDKGEYRIGGLPTENFPRFAFLDTENSMTLPADLLRNSIIKTIPAVAREESKFTLTGLLIEADPSNQMLRIVGSDSHRLHLIELPISDNSINYELSIIVPRKGALEIIKLLDGKSEVNIKTDNKFCLIETTNESLLVRLMDGSYPDYNAIIPKERIRSLNFDRIDMINLLKRISIIDPDPEVKIIKTTFSSSNVLIESMSKDASNAKEITKIEYNGEPFVSAVNARYMIDTLSIMKSDSIKFTLNDPNASFILEGEKDPGFISLIMPITLEEEYK